MKQKLILLSLFIFASACSNEEYSAPANTSDIDEKTSKPGSAAVTDTRSKASGRLRLGDEVFELDRVYCIKTAMATAIASDAQRRPAYPTLTIKTYDRSLTGTIPSNTANVIFNDDDRKEHWYFRTGNVNRKGNHFSANGFIEGKTMVTLPDGNLEPSRTVSPRVEAFDMSIRCRT